MHGADPVVWDADLADKAQAWADWMQSNGRMTHSDCYAYPNPLASTSGGTSTGISGTYLASGENLAWAQGSSGITKTCDQYTGEYNQACAVFNWYHEYTDYWTDPSDADLWQSASGMGHFTAMVWKGVEKIGCALGIPSTVIGLTLGAVGTSFPNLYASVLTAQVAASAA